ncbi:MAG: ABC transporter substrate-binding protein [Dehalococcoidia bacterium]|nr:ABC transporter substrate-binding protein [Dehalococcoidia bacterium]
MTSTVKKVVAHLIISGGLMLLVACGPAAQPSVPAGGEAPKEQVAPVQPAAGGVDVAKVRGGKLSMPNTAAFGNPNDPHLTATATGRVYAMPVTNGLLKRDNYQSKFPIVGELAKSWELSNNGLTYTFKLIEGVKFQNVPPVNGREFTSEDAKYNLLRITADPNLIIDKWKPRFQRALDFGEIKSIETPDKYTLVVNLAKAYAPFLDAVAAPGTIMLPREFVEKFPEKVILEGMIGTGPFIPNEYKNQQIASYKKNPDYWKKDAQGGQLPYLDELALVYFADSQTELASFRSRQLDTGNGINKRTVDSVKKDTPDTQIFTTPTATLTNLRFNMKFQPFQDVKVRRAIHLTLDRQQYLDVIWEGSGVITGPVTPAYGDLAGAAESLLSQPGYRKDKTQDLEEAKKLMKDAGYADGFTVGLMTSTNLAEAADAIAIFTDQLKPLKISIKGEVIDYAGQWVPRSTAGEFEMSYMNHALGSDADSLLSSHLQTGAPRNYGKFSDPVLDELVNKQKAASNLEERKKLAQDAEKRVLEQSPMTFLTQRVTFMMAQPWVHNAADGPVAGANLYLVERAWLDKR